MNQGSGYENGFQSKQSDFFFRTIFSYLTFSGANKGKKKWAVQYFWFCIFFLETIFHILSRWQPYQNALYWLTLFRKYHSVVKIYDLKLSPWLISLKNPLIKLAWWFSPLCLLPTPVLFLFVVKNANPTYLKLLYSWDTICE